MNPVHDQVTTVADKMTFAGSAGTLLAWASSSAFGMWMGIMIGVCGLLINLYFKVRTDRRNQAQHEAFMAKIHGAPDGSIQVEPEPQDADE